MCEVTSFKNFENSLTTVKVMTKTKVAPFLSGTWCSIQYRPIYTVRTKHWPFRI